ncbi:MAG: hypothetical protein PHN44_10240 [Candidatus Marinimicrobia bacterium]|nr:hypothetical protein [Candidatus Neomarinimicrobiota bacterium]
MRRKIKFINLFNRHDNYTTEIRFEIFRWLIASGWKYRSEGRWGFSGVFEQVWGLSTVNPQNYWLEYGFSGREYAEMQLAFMRAIISADCDEIVRQWRVEKHIGIDLVLWFDLKISDEPESEIISRLHKLFDAHKLKLTTRLNECYSEAVNIYSVLLTCNQHEWQAIMTYGFDGSSWKHVLAKQGVGTFGEFLSEACRELDRLTEKRECI